MGWHSLPCVTSSCSVCSVRSIFLNSSCFPSHAKNMGEIVTGFLLPWTKALCLVLPFIIQWNGTSSNSATCTTFHAHFILHDLWYYDRKNSWSGKTNWIVSRLVVESFYLFVNIVECGLPYLIWPFWFESCSVSQIDLVGFGTLG